MSKLIKSMIWPVIILGVLIVVVYYRAFLFSPEFNEPVDAAMNDASQSLSYEIPAYELESNETPVYNQLFGSDIDDDLAAENETVTLMKAEDERLAAAEVESDAATEQASDNELSLDAIVTAVKSTVTETLEIFKEENPQVLNAVSTDDAATLTKSEMLFKARLAYWNRDLKTAEDTYLKLTEISEDPNAYGELGNLYYMQSKWKKASDAYYHAAMKLKSINQLDQAHHLLRIIRGLDTETANKLQSELQQSS